MKKFEIIDYLMIFAIILFILVGCGSYPPSNEYNFVKVLGVTDKGDTILVDVDLLRPRVYNNYYYDNGINYRYPYNNWNNLNTPTIIIKPQRPIKPIPKPTINVKPIEKPRKNPKRN